MPLNQEEIKRRIFAARLLRNVSQAKLNQLGFDDGFGKEEMGRVERGELDFRPGKHLDPLCRYLRVPRWWFTADELDFGGLDAPASPDELASLVAQQNVLLGQQTAVLEEIKREVAEAKALKDETDERLRLLGRAVVEGRVEETLDPPPIPAQPSAEVK